MQKKVNYAGIIGILIFSVVMVISLINILTAKQFQFSAFIMSFFLVMIYVMPEYYPLMINFKYKGFIFMTGIKGTVVKKDYLDNDRIRFIVSIVKSYINNDNFNEGSGIGGFFNKFAGTVEIEVVDKASNFIDIPSKFCDDPSGCILYNGSPNNTALMPVFELNKRQAQEYHEMYTQLNTITERLYKEATLLAQQGNKVFSETAQKLRSIVRDMKGNTFVGGMGFPQMPQQGGK